MAASVRRQGRVADGVDAAVDAVQASGGDRAVDGPVRVPQVAQLPTASKGSATISLPPQALPFAVLSA